MTKERRNLKAGRGRTAYQRAVIFGRVSIVLLTCALPLPSCYDGKPSHDPLRGPWRGDAPMASERREPDAGGASQRSLGSGARDGDGEKNANPDHHSPRVALPVEGTRSSGGTPRIDGTGSAIVTRPHETLPRADASAALHAQRFAAALSGDAVTSTCVSSECHDSMAPTAEIHSRAAVESCEACHVRVEGADAHTFRLVPDDGGVCRACHNKKAAKKILHGPFRESRCLACHDAHGGGTKPSFLHREDGGLCIPCHEAGVEPGAHGPYARGECLSCHEPHESNFKSLARKSSAELCLDCHDEELVSTKGNRSVANIGAVISSSLVKHGPIRDGECSGCHNAHGTTNSYMLHKAYPKDFYQDYKASHYALCFQCHENTLVLEELTTTLTNFRDGDRNLHFLHVNSEKGRSCRACHEVHASNQPFHISETVPYGDSGWLLPINFAQTPTGGTCTPGCHLTRTYDR